MKKPFSIEAAKNGAKVVTRDGRPVEILKYDYIGKGKQRVVFCYTDDDGNNHACLANIDGIWEAGRRNKEDIFIEEAQKYRPYANAEEMDEEIRKHGAWVVKDHVRFSIYRYSDEYVDTVSYRESYNSLLKYYTWLDGTPCGVLEGGEE